MRLLLCLRQRADPGADHEARLLAGALATALLNRLGLAPPMAGNSPISERIRALLHRQSALISGVAGLAQALGLSERTLRRQCLREAQATPLILLHRLRLELADNLMRTSKLSVQQVAETVGFASAAHFSRHYHRQFGYPPSQAH
jgi:transcriptional regulator GlxA family with amidase domain